jgi:hypothetical protein
MIRHGVSRVSSKSKTMKPSPVHTKNTQASRTHSGRRGNAHIPRMELEQRPRHLTVVNEDSLLEMRAGDVIFLDESSSMRTMVESYFFAVLSCPGCGTLGLITFPQYNGIQPLICGADNCSCRFRILEKARFEYLPVS